MKRYLPFAAYILLFVSAVTFAAGQQYYSYPDARVFKNDDRMLIYQNKTGSRNLTGAGLKSVIQQVAWDDRQPRVFNTTTSSTIVDKIMYAVRNRRGVITRMQWESGGFYQGVPGYNHTYIYPYNNMTNVSRTTPIVIGSYWLTRGVIGKEITIQGGPAISPKALTYMGKISGLPNFDFINYSQADQSTLDAWYWGVSSVPTLAAHTTYTIRSAMPKSWGAMVNGLYSIGPNPCTYVLKNTSSAKAMNNYSTFLCRSTFKTGN